MPKPEWGTKRVCLNCSAKFYDLGRAQIVCPACGTPYDLETAGKAKRSSRARVAVADDDAPEAVADDDDEEEATVEEVEGSDDAVVASADDADDDEEEDQPLIEDSADLADDDVDSDVIDGDPDTAGEERA